MFVPAAVAIWMWANHFCTAVISVQRCSVIKWWRKWSSIYSMTPVQMFNDDLIEVTLENRLWLLADSLWQMSVPCKTDSGFAAKVIMGFFRVLALQRIVLFETSGSFTFLHNGLMCPLLSIDFDTLVFYWEQERLLRLFSYLCWQIHSALLITAITVNNWQLRTYLGRRRIYQCFLVIKRGICVSFSTWDQ